MAAININRNVDDVFYRYKMPRLVAKVEGKGNGIKTVIANMTDIAKALNRPPTYTTKFFGCELGAQTQVDTKNERYIVNGDHDQAKLQDTLDGFIKKFVLCQNCDNPETSLKVKKSANQIQQTCKACGHIGWIDMKHKLTTFIVKNPPPSEDTADSSAGLNKSKGPTAIENGHDSPENGGSDSGLVAQDDCDDDWEPEAADLPDGGVLTDRMKALIVHADLEKTADERLDMFYEWLKKHLKESGNKAQGRAVSDEAHRLDVKDKATLLLVSTLFTNKTTILNDIKANRDVIIRFTKANAKAQKYLLGGFEQMIAHKDYRDELMAKTPVVLKALYDEDLVDEETLLDWGKKPSKKFVSRDDSKAIITAAAPLLTWLKEAEEESDDDEDGIDVDFGLESQPATTNGVKKTELIPKEATATQNGHNSASNDDEDDDLDIDNI